MQLQAKPHPQTVSQNPLRELPRIEQAVGCVPTPLRVFAEGRGKNRAGYRRMLSHKIARKFIIAAAAEHKLQFIARGERLQIGEVEAVSFARIRTLHVHNLDHLRRHFRQRAARCSHW